MQSFDYVCARVTAEDDVAAIAKYLHLTDPYIYPGICIDPEDVRWRSVIAQCLKQEGNIYSMGNIWVAKCGGQIVGVACMVPCGTQLTFLEGIELPEGLQETMAPVVDGYFAPLIRESAEFDGHNIVNVCVDSRHWGRGVGRALVETCVEACGGGTVHLDVIADNAGALRLYRRCGFTMESAYLGFSGSAEKLPCYHMVRKGS